uniref:Uncharacterized protein n=1 Tax=Clastoptera arizonana TaxID=38151 RepID=A0A1B6DXC5_9HEMI
MFSFHKPKVYRSPAGCCICKAKSSSSRFTDSKKYEEDFMDCFQLEEKRAGEVCNACVLLVKRWKKLPPGTQRHWRHVVDARAGPGTKSFVKIKSKKNKRKNKVQKKDDEEMEDEDKKVNESLPCVDYNLNEGGAGTLSDPPSPRSEEEELAVLKRPMSLKRVPAQPPVSAFLDLTYWKREKVCCGIIFTGQKSEVIIDPRFLKQCSACRSQPAVASSTTTKGFSDSSSDSGYDESSNQGEVVQVILNNN